MIQVIRKRLWADEGAPASTRYNQETDEVETTPDGGATWNPDPGSDPRVNPAYQLPPNPDGACAAAAGMIVQMRIFVTGMGQATAIGIANTVLLMLLFALPGAGWLFGVALAVASGVLTAGVGVIAAAFTEPVWEQLLCILYCNIEDDGTVTQADLDELQADILDQCGETVAAGTAFMWRTWGFVGLTNAGVKNADPEADCDDCACDHCFEIDLTQTDGSEFGLVLQGGTWVDGEGLVGVFFDSNNNREVYGYWAFPETVQATSVGMIFSKDNGAGANNVTNLFWLDPATSYSTTAIFNNGTAAYGLHIGKSIGDKFDPCSGIGFDINTGTIVAICQVERLIVTYRGDIPSGWSDNC